MTVKISKRGLALLKRARRSQHESIKLTTQNAKQASELVTAGLAILIPQAAGGADICITQAGLDYVTRESDD